MKKWLKRFAFTILILLIIVNIMSAFHAYKFTHFYADAAPIKKPEQMSFGDKATAIFAGVKYPKSKVVDSLKVVHATIKIPTEDNLMLEAWENIRVNNSSIKNTKGTIILFHGHGSSKSGTIKEAEVFDSLGYNILLVDFRGHGNSDGTICSIGYNESKDVKAAYDYVESRGEKNIILWGVSLGAATIIKAIKDYNIKPTKVIIEMPFASLHDAVKGRVRTMGLPEQPISTLLCFWGGVELGFNAFSHDPSEYARKVTCPVLLQWGLQDKRVSEPETKIIFANISSVQKQLVVYTTSGHVSLCKTENKKWITTVTDFLNR